MADELPSGITPVVEASPQHMQASAEALSELAEVVTSKSARGGNDVFVDLVHYQHGYFLGHQLHGFPMLPTVAGEVSDRESFLPDDLPADFALNALAEWADVDEIQSLHTTHARGLYGPSYTTREHPFTWATVATQPVAAQIAQVLEALSSLLVRQSPEVQGLREEPIALMKRIEEDERSITTGVASAVSRSGWKRAATDVRLRAESTGKPLRVRYRAPVHDVQSLAERAPYLRQAYNQLKPVRNAVDRVASAMAQSLYLSGPGSAETFRLLNDQFEHMGLRKHIAHAIRDSFVCGNGAIVLAEVTSGSLRLIAPEDLVSVSRESAVVRTDGREELISPVLHIPGGRQLGSNLGVSFLEPFIRLCIDRNTMLSALLTCETFDASTHSPPSAREWAAQMKPVAKQKLRDLDRHVVQVLGSAADNFPDPVDGLYFAGHERMQPATGRIILIDASDLTGRQG